MIVSVRNISAKCSECGARDFSPATKGQVKLSTRMSCTRCGHGTSYRALLESIGEEAMRRANDALEKLKKTRPSK